MSGFLYEVKGFIERKLKLKSLISVTVIACGGLQAGYATAATCYADSVSALQACLNTAEADAENWHEIQLKEKTYYLTSPLTLTKGKVRLVGAGRVLHDSSNDRAGEPYSANIERLSDRKALSRAKFFVLDGQNQTRIFSAVDDAVDENEVDPGGLNLMLYIQGLTFKNGDPIDNEGGGGLRFKGRKLIVEHSIFTGNSDSALWHYASDQQAISDSYFYNNTGEYSTSNVCPPSGGTSKYWGGAITASGYDYDIYRSTFENNRGCRGGAIWAAAEMGLHDSTVSNNTAALGGGVYVADGATGAAGINYSTIYDNAASNKGGGLYFEQQRSVEAWIFYNNILAGNSASSSTFSDCHLEGEPGFGGQRDASENILGRIGVGAPDGDCTYWLNPQSNQSAGVLDPQLEELAYNGSIGLQLKTHLPSDSSISLDVASSNSDGTCSDQRARDNTIAASSQNKCAAGATQRIQQANGTWGSAEAPWSYFTHYKMVLTESQNIQIDLASDEEDVRLVLSDANNNEIEDTENHASPTSSSARITRQLSAGVYYINSMISGSWANLDPDLLADYFLSVNAEVELIPNLVFKDTAEIAGRSTLGQTGNVLWKRTGFPRPSGTSGDYYYKMDSSAFVDAAIFESDFFDPADTELTFKYRMNGEYSGSLYLDIELDGVWHYDYWVRSSSNLNHISPDWQQATYDLSWLASQGYDKVRIRLFGWQDQYSPWSSHSLLLDNILLHRYIAWH